MSQYQRNKRELLKEKCLNYLGGKKCRNCGVDFLPICCYDFHHRNNKDEDISKMLSGGCTWKKIKKELDKCLVVCSNCHRIIHAHIDTSKSK